MILLLKAGLITKKPYPTPQAAVGVRLADCVGRQFESDSHHVRWVADSAAGLTATVWLYASGLLFTNDLGRNKIILMLHQTDSNGFHMIMWSALTCSSRHLGGLVCLSGVNWPCTT